MSHELGQILIAFLRLLSWVIIGRALVSWFIRDPKNPIVRVLATLTDPILKPFQKYLTFGAMDFTPMAFILVLYGLQMVVLRQMAG